jgi:hypothetical protein
VDTEPHTADYERTARLSSLVKVNGMCFLDAGRGPRAYAEWLADHAALAVAIDANRKMLMLPHLRLGKKAQVVRSNLDTPLISWQVLHWM